MLKVLSLLLLVFEVTFVACLRFAQPPCTLNGAKSQFRAPQTISSFTLSVAYLNAYDRSVRVRKPIALQAAQSDASQATCSCCKGKQVISCEPCAGTGRDKVNGNVFERWTCTKCKGFGLIPCRLCSSSTGLTPEQRLVFNFTFVRYAATCDILC